MLESLIQNLWIITPAVWVLLVSYLTWYFAKVKRYSPISQTEAKQLWIIHKQSSNCCGKKWHQVKNRNQTVGFECECGYKHMQEKPLVAHSPIVLETPQVSAFDKLHTSHKSA